MKTQRTTDDENDQMIAKQLDQIFAEIDPDKRDGWSTPSSRCINRWKCAISNSSWLHICVDNGASKMATYLLYEGADPDRRDNEGFAPLLKILLYSCIRCSNRYDCDFCRYRLDGNLPQRWWINHMSLPCYKDSWKCIEPLILFGATVSEEEHEQLEHLHPDILESCRKKFCGIIQITIPFPMDGGHFC